MGKSVFLPFVIIKLVFIYTERHMMKHLISALFLSCNLACLAAQEITIIPKPVEMHQGKGSFQLNPQTIITYQTTLRPQAEYLQEVIAASTGWDLKITEGKPVSGSIHLAQNTSSGQAEAYNLVVKPEYIHIEGTDAGGVFYGIQTLLQLFPSEIYSATRQKNVQWEAPAITISDAPSHPWRGMMLDVARYFYDKDFVKKYIDMMAMYKMNKLQFHLIDDSGWRMKKKKYPKLTEIGAWAGKESVGWILYTRRYQRNNCLCKSTECRDHS